MKKFISMLAGVVMASSLFAVSAYAAGNVSMTLDKTEVAVGEKVVVTINSAAKTISVDGFNVDYDENVFKCVDILDDAGYSVNGEGEDAIYLAIQYKSGRNFVDLTYGCSTIAEAAKEGKAAFYAMGTGNDMTLSAKDGFAQVVLEALVAADTSSIVLNEGSAGAGSYKGVCQTADVTVKGNDPIVPPAPTASVAISAAKKTTDAAWIAEKGNTMFWGVDFANGGFNGTAVAKIFSDAKERELTIATPAGAEINGEASFGVFVIVGDSTDAIGLTITSGDVTATAAPVAYADAE